MYGTKSLAHTGLAMAGIGVAGIVVPFYALGAAGLVIAGATILRIHHKLTSHGR